MLSFPNALFSASALFLVRFFPVCFFPVRLFPVRFFPRTKIECLDYVCSRWTVLPADGAVDPHKNFNAKTMFAPYLWHAVELFYQLSVELLTTSSPSSYGPDDQVKPKERNAQSF